MALNVCARPAQLVRLTYFACVANAAKKGQIGSLPSRVASRRIARRGVTVGRRERGLHFFLTFRRYG